MSKKPLAALMANKAKAVQAIVEEMTSLEDAFHYTLQMTQKQGGRHVTAAGFHSKEFETLTSLCQDESLNLLHSPLRDHTDKLHTVITPVEWGLADTGTLVLN